MFVPSGTRLTYVGQFGGSDFLVSDIASRLQDAGAYLKNNFNLVIESSSNDYGYVYSSSFSITLHLISNMDRGNGSDGLEDIRSNVDDAFANHSGGSFDMGAQPTGSRIADYKLPGSSVQQTGAPGPPSPGPGGGSGNPVSSWWDSLVGKVEAGSIGFMVGAIAVVGLLVFFAVKSEAT